MSFRKFMILLLSFTLLGCSNSDKQPTQSFQFETERFFANGQFASDNFTFCGIVPIEQSYSFKTGNWEFYLKSGKRFAFGKFSKKLESTHGSGGCTYNTWASKIEIKDWQFWNENDEITTARSEMIEELELAQPSPYLNKLK